MWDETPKEALESLYGRTDGRVIRIGATSARVISVTQTYIKFLDEDGNAHSIDLEECHRNYVAWLTKEKSHGHIVSIPGGSRSPGSPFRCVGFRGALDDPAWMGFTSKPPTIFEFRSRAALYQQLLAPLMQSRWDTFDAD